MTLAALSNLFNQSFVTRSIIGLLAWFLHMLMASKEAKPEGVLPHSFRVSQKRHGTHLEVSLQSRFQGPDRSWSISCRSCLMNTENKMTILLLTSYLILRAREARRASPLIDALNVNHGAGRSVCIGEDSVALLQGQTIISALLWTPANINNRDNHVLISRC